MSIISCNPVKYTTFLAVIECNIVKNFSELDIVESFPLDIKYNDDRTQLINVVDSKQIIVQESTKICSTRSKNKLNPIQSIGFVKISYPKNKDMMLYTNPAELIYIGAYCIYCKMIGPIAHIERCPRPRKTSLKLTLRGIIQFIPKYKDIKCIEDINEGVTIDDLGLFKYTDDNEKGDNVNIQFKENIIKFFDDMNNNINILTNDYIDGTLNFDTETNIPISIVIANPGKDQRGYLPGPIMIKRVNSNGVGVNIRVQLKPKKNEFSIMMISNPYSEKNLYLDVINRINNNYDDEVKITYRNSSIKSFFAESVIFLDKTKRLDSQKIMNYLWSDDYNDVRLSSSNINKSSHDTDTYSYIQFDPDSDIFYRYSMISNYVTHTDRVCINLISSRKTKTGILSGPDKFHIQMFSQGHFQITFTHCNSKIDKDTIQLTEFRKMEDQFPYIERVINTVATQFVNFLIKLDIKDNIILHMDNVEFKPHKKLLDTVGGAIAYAKKRSFDKNTKVQIFSYKNMSWSDESHEIMSVLDSKSDNKLYKVRLASGKIENLYHNVLRNDERGKSHGTDQVCRLTMDNAQKQPVPYSFTEPICQNGYDKIVKPFGIIGRDNRYYPCPIEIKQNDIEWLRNFVIKGITHIERNMYMISYMQTKIPGFEKKIDPLCGIFKYGTTSIGSIVLVDKLYPIVKKRKRVVEDTEEDGDYDGDDYYDDEEDSKYTEVEILSKMKPNGFKYEEPKVVIYNVMRLSDRREYTTFGHHFHSKHLENRDFMGLTELAEINKLKTGIKTTVKQLLIECFERFNLIGYQQKHVYSNHLKLMYSEPYKLRHDLYNFIIPHSMNLLTHTVISITNIGLFINNVKRIDLNFEDELIKDIKLQCLGYNNTFYVIDTIDGGRDRFRIHDSKKILDEYDFINTFNDLGIHIIFDHSNHSYDDNNCTKVYIDHDSNKQRFIVPKGICKRNIVLQVFSISGYHAMLGITEDGEQYDTVFKNTAILIGDYVEVKLNILPNGILYETSPTINPVKVTEVEYLGSQKTEELLGFIMRRSVVE
jgi:hypothetical protein